MAKQCNLNYILVIVFVLFVVLFFMRREGFQSPGTLTQLASTHVPTAEDAYYYHNVYPKLVRREITDMTGGDPGPLRPGLLSLYGE
jgi:hypothetical protein